MSGYQYEKYVERVVDAAPPLRDEQRNRISALLRESSGEVSEQWLARETQRVAHQRQAVQANVSDAAPRGPIGDQTMVYRYWDEAGVLLYVGISSNVSLRDTVHQRRSKWARFQTDRTDEVFDTRDAARSAEAEAIEREQPVFNIVGAHQDARGRAVQYLVDHGALDLLTPARPST